jgi:hypothetical protein
MEELKLPEVIKIGGFDYKVEMKDKAFASVNNEVCDGTISYSQHLININNDMDFPTQLSTLLHETLHGIFTDRQIMSTMAKGTEESTVENMVNGLVQLFRDNKELLNLINNLYPERK